jgi:hypothetical protein
MSARASSSGPLELRPEGARWTQAIAGLLFSLFWNGMVVFMVLVAIKAHAPWVALAFLSLFALIGVALLGITVYLFLQIFGPRPVVTLARSDLALGDEIGCSWRVVGRSATLTHFRISLCGVESASYRRGTDRTTETHTFHESVVFETDRPALAARGSATLRIPRDSMHSWDGGDNSISWNLSIEGAVPRWADIDDSFELEVAPRRRLER